jgi:hypothetical protein
LPSSNVEETKETFPAWEVEEYVDPGSRGTADYRNLLKLPGVQSFEVTPALGTEIKVGRMANTPDLSPETSSEMRLTSLWLTFAGC